MERARRPWPDSDGSGSHRDLEPEGPGRLADHISDGWTFGRMSMDDPAFRWPVIEAVVRRTFGTVESLRIW